MDAYSTPSESLESCVCVQTQGLTLSPTPHASAVEIVDCDSVYWSPPKGRVGRDKFWIHTMGPHHLILNCVYVDDAPRDAAEDTRLESSL